MTGDPFEFAGNVEQPLRFRFSTIGRRKFGGKVNRAIDRHATPLGPDRYHFRNPVRLSIRHAERSACIPYGAPSLHRAERNNLGNFVIAIPLGNIRNHFIPSVIGKIKVYIRRTRPHGV